MIIIGCDFHTRYQQIAMANDETGELLLEQRLDHASGEAHGFYRNLQAPVRVGIEATGPLHWFELLLAKRFPKIWVPTPAERDLRQLLWHRHKLVGLHTMLGNQLHALAMSQGLCRKKKLFTKKGRMELTHLTLAPWASRRREEILRLLDQLEAPIEELDRAVMEEAKRREDAVLLLTHPGIGPVTSLAFVLTIGPITRFACSKKISSYLGLNPSEYSSGGRRRLGAISKQGNPMVRWLLIEAVYPAVRKDPALRQDYQRLKFRRGHAVAKVAIARKLAGGGDPR